MNESLKAKANAELAREAKAREKIEREEWEKEHGKASDLDWFKHKLEESREIRKIIAIDGAE